jgi:hopanoid-associated phosphorylase
VTIGVVTGLAAEAKIATAAGLVAFACGGDPTRAGAIAARLIAEGASLIVSFGLAGGLDPALAPGTLIVADTVIDGEALATDPSWTARLRVGLPGAVGGAIAGVDGPLATVAAKAALRATGAVAVDTESHAIARAAGRSVPFVVVRAIADPAAMALPPAALVAPRPDGGIAVHRVLASVAVRPTQIPDLIRLARASRAAFAALRHAAAALGAQAIEARSPSVIARLDRAIQGPRTDTVALDAPIESGHDET